MNNMVSPRKALTIFALALLFVVAIITVVNIPRPSTPSAKDATEGYRSPTVTVSYEVIAKNPFTDYNVINVTYMDATGGIQQYSHYKSPFRVSFSAGRGAVLSLNAQRDDDGDGSVRVNIYIDGTLFRTATSHGDYALAQVAGQIP